MKILYGVQATGNGHISRARALSKELARLGLDTDYLFSGRERERFFDMDGFGDWRCYRGLTFVHHAGEMQIMDTVRQNSLVELMRDIRSLDLRDYDVVITDFEPITAWAAKRAGKPCVGMGHQYAFEHSVPRRGDNLVSRSIMRHFAPADISLGLHWHHFNGPVLPPIAETPHARTPVDPHKVIVYLGFEDLDDVLAMLEPCKDTLFVVYGPFSQYESRGHIQLKPLSREGFQQDLASASGVICNAGFELSSEAIQLGKKLLVKPLTGQMEQLSNAAALECLGLGMTMTQLDAATVREWLDHWQGKRVLYPNVAAAIAGWVAERGWENPASRATLASQLWQQVQAPDVEAFAPSPDLLAA